jgi:transglutaminase-like putative cysteine protease
MLQLYRLLTAVLAFTGCISLVMSGEVNPLMSLTGIGLFPGYYRFLRGMPCAPKWAISGCSVLTLFVFFFDALIISNDYFLAVAHLTITFQAIKSFDLKEPWDHLQVYFMALLQLIIISELIYSIAFGIIFIFFLIAFVSVIVFAHFMKEGTMLSRSNNNDKVSINKPVIYISLLTLMITVIFFVSIPRVSEGLWGKGHKKSIRTSGFSEKVDFGSFGDVKLDSTVVMRIEIDSSVKGPYYWRGMTLNHFDGISWKDTIGRMEWIYKENERFNIKPFREDRSVVQRIFLEPMDTDVIFGLSEIAAVESKGRIILMDKAGALFLPAKKGKRFDYIVYSVSDMSMQKGFINKYLQLPAGIERITRLSHNITGRKDKDIDKAKKIEKYLRENYTYSLSTSRPPEGISPIDDFLFNSKKGYCEHYATSMALMLRTVGIPSRVVTGFLGGEMNKYGRYLIVRQSNAHSWVEALIDGKWKRFDPTPPGLVEQHSALALYIDMLRMMWERYVVAFSISDQREIVRAFSIPFRQPLSYDFRLHRFYGIIYLLLLLPCIIVILFLFRHLQFRRYGFVTAQYMKLRKTVKNKGATITLSSTPSEVIKEVVQFGIGGKVEEFIKLYEESRFGGKEMKGEDKARYQNLMEEIKSQLRH